MPTPPPPAQSPPSIGGLPPPPDFTNAGGAVTNSALKPLGFTLLPEGATPRYYLRDVLPILDQIRSKGPDALAEFQRQLSDSQYITASSYAPGDIDVKSATFQAVADLLTDANASTPPGGQTPDWQDVLNAALQRANQPYVNTVTGQPVQRGKKPLLLEYTNPMDVRATADDSALKLLGRNLTNQELDRFQNIWKSQESSYQNVRAGALSAGGNQAGLDYATGNITGGIQGSQNKMPNMGEAASQYAASLDPVAWQANTIADMAGKINDMLRGPQLEREAGSGSEPTQQSFNPADITRNI